MLNRPLQFDHSFFTIMRCLLLVLAACLPGGCTHRDSENPRVMQDVSFKILSNRFQAELQRLRADAGFPGATAAFVLGDGGHATFAIGQADVERGIPMTPDARMLSGSTGKSFVAATALALALEGRLDLDKPIAVWLGSEPWFAHLPNGPHITLRMLLRHQSGLPDHVHSPRFAAALRTKVQTEGLDATLGPLELVALILDTPPLFAAGQGYTYSDTNYILAGLIIERASGKSYYQELRQRFLSPLGLRLTTPADRRRLPGLVPGYIRGKAPFGLPHKIMGDDGALLFNPATEWTGGGLVTNPADLVLWAKTLYEGKAMPGAYLRDLLAAVPKDAAQQARYGASVRYGLGVTLRKSRLGTAYGHRGWAPGYQSGFEYYPAYRMAVALQINQLGGHDMARYVERLADVLRQPVSY